MDDINNVKSPDASARVCYICIYKYAFVGQHDRHMQASILQQHNKREYPIVELVKEDIDNAEMEWTYLASNEESGESDSTFNSLRCSSSRNSCCHCGIYCCCLLLRFDDCIEQGKLY